MNGSRPVRISFFVSSHGFGHASRACAVMQSLRRQQPDLSLRVYTRTPEWFFRDSVGRLDYRAWQTDIGLVQRSPLREDVPATLAELAAFMPFRPGVVDRLAAEIADQDLVVCDVSPLGLRAAAAAGVESVLIENFTWDWIYRAYMDAHPGLAPFIDYVEAVNRTAGLRIQAEPVCQPVPDAVIAGPIARGLHEGRVAVRERLEIDPETPLVLVSMGGVPAEYPFLGRLPDRDDCVLLLPGAATERRRDGALLMLPERSGFHHPDLVNACDALVCKAGYSTLAEAYQAGVPLAWFPRERFPESPVLDAFIVREMSGIRLRPSDWDDGTWIERLPELLSLGRRPPAVAPGGDQVANLLLQRLHR
ncbi:hypothetical protein [Thioalkalivibrio sp.]|uniref:hypothetical protein n=1 Tax=Thioalkalivibrio sp. TaxID=2093813 RepID=UPI00397487E1